MKNQGPRSTEMEVFLWQIIFIMPLSERVPNRSGLAFIERFKNYHWTLSGKGVLMINKDPSLLRKTLAVDVVDATTVKSLELLTKYSHKQLYQKERQNFALVVYDIRDHTWRDKIILQQPTGSFILENLFTHWAFAQDLLTKWQWRDDLGKKPQ